jgi:hypothetical protein
MKPNISFIQAYEELERIYAATDCECKDEPPYDICRSCTAAHAVNEAGAIMRDALKELHKE